MAFANGTAADSAASGSTASRPWLLLHLDYILVLAAVLLSFAGWLTIRGGAEGNAVLLASAQRQAFWLAGGTLAFAAAVLFDYQKLLRVLPWLYGGNLLLLVAVLFFGSTIKGARAWFSFGGVSFQPAEPMKIVTVLMLAYYFALRPERIRTPRELLAPGLIAGVPAALILLQPDLGTAVVFGATLFVMLAWAGASARLLGLIVAAGILCAGAMYPFLKPYQKERILVFLDPERDPRGSGYNVLQSRIAIGNGGLFGQGWKRGTQTTRRFLPEHHTDFVFASAVEQFGAVGGATILGLYGLLLARIHRTVRLARDRFGSFIAAGIGAIVTTHLLLNVSMTMGLVPVTGLPLPLLSYGGSFAVSVWLMLGIVAGIGARRFLFVSG